MSIFIYEHMHYTPTDFSIKGHKVQMFHYASIVMFPHMSKGWDKGYGLYHRDAAGGRYYKLAFWPFRIAWWSIHQITAEKIKE